MSKVQGTLIHGVASSEHLDSSGERILISGMDISSLEKDGVLTWEHKNDSPSQVIGKIIRAKKIFSEKDCETPNELHFWQKTQMPFVYIIGELFDAVGHQQAKDVVAMLNYDSAKQAEKNVVNFSVEGAKLEKKGQEITRSVARKVTCTVTPCNKKAIAEKLDPAKPKGDPLSVFKSEEMVEAEILEKAIVWQYNTPKAPAAAPKAAAPFQAPRPAAPKPLEAAPEQPQAHFGSKIGSTKSGKDVFSHMKPRGYANWSAQDHHDAMNVHMNAATKVKGPKLSEHHRTMAAWHGEARDRHDRKENRFKTGLAQHNAKILGKTLTAGSGDVAPGNKTGGSALATTDLEDCARMWKGYSEAVELITKSYPEMTKDEAEALAKLVSYRAFQKAEEALPDVTSSRKEKYAPDAKQKRIERMEEIRRQVEANKLVSKKAEDKLEFDPASGWKRNGKPLKKKTETLEKGLLGKIGTGLALMGAFSAPAAASSKHMHDYVNHIKASGLPGVSQVSSTHKDTGPGSDAGSYKFQVGPYSVVGQHAKGPNTSSHEIKVFGPKDKSKHSQEHLSTAKQIAEHLKTAGSKLLPK